MSHSRVIPRDLFNEAKLLKCYGQLALAIHEGKIEGIAFEENEDPFEIILDGGNNGLFIGNLTLVATVNGLPIFIETAYNSREPYPLCTEDGIAVFTDEGEIAQEFRDYVKELIAQG